MEQLGYVKVSEKTLNRIRHIVPRLFDDMRRKLKLSGDIYKVTTKRKLLGIFPYSRTRVDVESFDRDVTSRYTQSYCKLDGTWIVIETYWGRVLLELDRLIRNEDNTEVYVNSSVNALITKIIEEEE